MPTGSRSGSRPRIIVPEYVVRIADRCHCTVDKGRVTQVLAKLYGSSRAKPHFITFICTATVLMYKSSVVAKVNEKHAKSRKAANKQFALALCVDCLQKNGYRMHAEQVTEAEIQALSDGELTVVKIKAWVKKYYRKA